MPNSTKDISLPVIRVQRDVRDDSMEPSSPVWCGAKTITAWWLFDTPSLFNDPAFTDADWIRHHSWVRHVPTPPRFFLVVFGIWPLIAWQVFITTAFGLYAEFLQPKGWPVLVSGAYLQPFLLLSFALSLLLVFRTSSSYDRWWEARKAFGAIYNCQRNIARLALAYVAPAEQQLRDEVVRWASVLCAACCTFLRDDTAFLAPYTDVLTPSQHVWLRRAPQPPIAAAQVISALLSRSESLTPFGRAEIERKLAQFDGALGACERIRRQPIPLAYTRHTSRLLILYCSFLPMGMWAYTSWLTIPMLAALTFLLSGIENIGIKLEQPLFRLPLEGLAAGGRKAVEAVASSQGMADRWATECCFAGAHK